MISPIRTFFGGAVTGVGGVGGSGWIGVIGGVVRGFVGFIDILVMVLPTVYHSHARVFDIVEI